MSSSAGIDTESPARLPGRCPCMLDAYIWAIEREGKGSRRTQSQDIIGTDRRLGWSKGQKKGGGGSGECECVWMDVGGGC